MKNEYDFLVYRVNETSEMLVHRTPNIEAAIKEHLRRTRIAIKEGNNDRYRIEVFYRGMIQA